ncbi:hypothetical protein [Leptospira weilii]|uniref:hypothetical protein n=1 Tax=Leptospira weilii TaxID=28184 RepID=UPI000366E039|nr:hypothetical protein [Leptospira weilii]
MNIKNNENIDTKITLKNLSQKTNQEVFDYIIKHLLTQNSISINEMKSCLYRGPYGKKCAAGVLIGDEEYSPDFEGRTWIGLCDDRGFPQAHKHLIAKLQRIHDNVSVEHWRRELKQLAHTHGLNFWE